MKNEVVAGQFVPPINSSPYETIPVIELSINNPMMKTTLASIVFLMLGVPLHAQTPPPSTANDSHALKKVKNFSPYAGRNFPTDVYFGDTHLHTNQSMDAGAFGCRLGPEDAHRFARGEEVSSTGGLKVKLSRPLDFLVVADHSDNLGFFPDLFAGDPKMLANPQAKKWYDMIQEGGQTGVAAGLEIVLSAAAGTMSDDLVVSPTSDRFRSAWEETVAAAEKYNEPGVYTALHGYEWTSMPGGDNLHRVVIYRDGGDEAKMMIPYTVVPPYGSDDPRDLWKWMAAYEKKTGGHVLAIAHNGNLSNGQMFPTVESFNGKPVDAAYVRNRIKWEPLYETTQIKGDGEAHPFLSPNDEFADYETWDQSNIGEVPKTNDMLQFEYARNALGNGLDLEKKLGTNPYKFGFVGSTDSHTGLATAQEDNFFGKHSAAEPAPDRVEHPVFKIGDLVLPSSIMTSSGLAAVWARENTREALFDAMMNKETYATTGSRMRVRFFGGWDFTKADAQNRRLADIGYQKGIPMGGDLTKPPAGKSPSFLVTALRDPYSGNLDRIQVVKVWVDASGKKHERVFNAVWSDNRKIGTDGTLPKVGNTVDVANATWTNTIGASELITVWTDPEFDPKVSAAYYARVLEIPTPRWTAYEAQRYGIKMEDNVPMITVERAYTSPIWYTP
jgi:hypothetical protein